MPSSNERHRSAIFSIILGERWALRIKHILPLRNRQDDRYMIQADSITKRFSRHFIILQSIGVLIQPALRFHSEFLNEKLAD